MRRALALAAAALCLLPGAAGAAGWRSEQPSGANGAPLLGKVGDIECWSADRCLLITGGNSGVAAGLFAYDGRGWYRYATVCGGAEGRIAWVGPDEFWTVSDQQKGQETSERPAASISLCHFKGGQVLASYAKPIGRSDSYLKMNGAVCAGAADCWFAGERLPATVNQGAFHLHWDGSALTAVPSLTNAQPQIEDPGRGVGALALHEGSLFESVAVRSGDTEAVAEAEEPSLLHRIEPGLANPFVPLFGAAPIEAGGEPVNPRSLAAAALTGVAGGPLWAVAGSVENSATGRVVVLQVSGADQLTQLALSDPGGLLADAGERVEGAAAEAGGPLWLGVRRQGEIEELSSAHLVPVAADGSVGPEVVLPAGGEAQSGEVLGPKGFAGPIACAGPGQCWMATSRGWLFHLGPDPNPSADPAARPAPITTRPVDESLPAVPPIEPPEDVSGLDDEKPSEQEEIPGIATPRTRREKPLYEFVGQRLVNGTMLELTFVLRKRSHVRLLASRGGRVVACSPRYTMGKGRRHVLLRLERRRWPTKLDLEVDAVQGRASK